MKIRPSDRENHYMCGDSFGAGDAIALTEEIIRSSKFELTCVVSSNEEGLDFSWGNSYHSIEEIESHRDEIIHKASSLELQGKFNGKKVTIYMLFAIDFDGWYYGTDDYLTQEDFEEMLWD